MAKTRRVPARKSAPRTKNIHELSVAQRKRVFSAVNRVMKEHGLKHRVSALHLSHPAAVGGCPPGQELRMVCHKDKRGTVVCAQQCVPIR